MKRIGNRNSAKMFILILFLLTPLLAFSQTDVSRSYFSEDTVLVVAERNVKIPTTSLTATKLPVPLRKTPASVGVVTRALIDNQDGVVLSDVLRNVSGVNIQTNFAVHDYFIVRGFDSLTNGLVLTDGASEPEAAFYNTYNLERVEVLKGPGAFLYGGNPLSGTVNLIRKHPILKNFFHASGSYGRFQSSRGTVDLGLASLNSGVAFRLNGLWQDSELYRDDKDNKTFAINPALTWTVNDKTSLAFNFEYVNSEYKPDSGLPLLNNQLPDVPRTHSFQTPFDFSDQNTLRARVDFESRVSDSFTLRNKFYYTDLDWDTDGTLIVGAFPDQFGNTWVARTITTLDDRQKLAGNQLEGIFLFNSGAIAHRLLTGFEVNRLSDVFALGVDLNVPLIDLFNPVESAAAVNAFPRMEADGRSITFAPYLLDQISFSEKFQILVGGRYDAINYRDDKRTLYALDSLNVLIPIPNPVDREYSKFSPMVGVVFSPVSSLSLYANGGQAFAPPSSQTVGEPEAEESTQFEVGAKATFLNGKLNSTVALFDLKKKNMTIPDYTGITFTIGEQKSKGIEFDVMVQPMHNWQAFLTYAFTDAELTSFSENVLTFDQQPITVDYSGNTPAFAPKHILNFWTNKEFEFGLGIGGGARYISGQFIDEDNVYEIDSAIVVDAMLYYTIGQWRWSVNLKNVTDEKYEARGFSSSSVIPANPIAIFGALEFTL